jgi:hypothetical protein
MEDLEETWLVTGRPYPQLTPICSTEIDTPADVSGRKFKNLYIISEVRESSYQLTPKQEAPNQDLSLATMELQLGGQG